jgi:hypothetical protein
MKPDIKNKLILQLLPAIASRNIGFKPASQEELRSYWTDCLNEANALAELYEKFITPEPTEEKKDKAPE